MSQFLDRIKERAMADKKTIVLAEGEEIRSIEAAAKVLKEYGKQPFEIVET